MPVLSSQPAQLGAQEPFAIAVPVPFPVTTTRLDMSLAEGKGLINPFDEIIITLEAFFMEKDEPANVFVSLGWEQEQVGTDWNCHQPKPGRRTAPLMSQEHLRGEMLAASPLRHPQPLGDGLLPTSL